MTACFSARAKKRKMGAPIKGFVKKKNTSPLKKIIIFFDNRSSPQPHVDFLFAPVISIFISYFPHKKKVAFPDLFQVVGIKKFKFC